MQADAYRVNNRIHVYTKTRGSADFAEALAACKRVGGGRFKESQREGKYWSYPLSVDTCLALRRSFGDALIVHICLSAWYRSAVVDVARHEQAAAATDAVLAKVPASFSSWLRPYQRAGAAALAQPYRGAKINADKPGVGKTGETLAALLEMGVTGPVLIACKRTAVRLVWRNDIQQHLGAPVWACTGARTSRERAISEFTQYVQDNPNSLCFLVVIHDMLRIVEKPLCLEETFSTPAPRCKGEPPHEAIGPDGIRRNHVPHEKKKVQVGFSYPELYDTKRLGGGWQVVILDEARKLLGSLTIAKGNLRGKGLRNLPLRPNAVKFPLDGTPFGKGGRVQGFFGTLHWCWPDEYSSFWRWAGEHLEVEEKTVNRAGLSVKKIIGLKGLSANLSEEEREAAHEIFLATLGPRILRRTTEEALPGLPPKNIVEVPCEMTAQQRAQYRQLAEDGEIKTRTGLITVNGMLALRTRERQIANGEIFLGGRDLVSFTGRSGKLERLYEKLEEHGIYDGTVGTRVVIASQFLQFLEALDEHLASKKVPYFRIDGWTSDKDRLWQVEEWQRGKCEERVFLIQSSTGGDSITLDAADEMHVLDESDDPGANEQLENRIWRGNNLTHRVTIYYYRTEGTIDYRLAHNVEDKRRIQHAIMDGRRGVSDLRRIMIELPKEEE